MREWVLCSFIVVFSEVHVKNLMGHECLWIPNRMSFIIPPYSLACRMVFWDETSCLQPPACWKFTGPPSLLRPLRVVLGFRAVTGKAGPQVLMPREWILPCGPGKLLILLYRCYKVLQVLTEETLGISWMTRGHWHFWVGLQCPRCMSCWEAQSPSSSLPLDGWPAGTAPSWGPHWMLWHRMFSLCKWSMPVVGCVWELPQGSHNSVRGLLSRMQKYSRSLKRHILLQTLH